VAEVADGVIVGSAVVRHLAEAANQPRESFLRGLESSIGDLATAAAAGPKASM
jgi:tryptophan synthase alpha subunit